MLFHWSIPVVDYAISVILVGQNFLFYLYSHSTSKVYVHLLVLSIEKLFILKQIWASDDIGIISLLKTIFCILQRHAMLQ